MFIGIFVLENNLFERFCRFLFKIDLSIIDCFKFFMWEGKFNDFEKRCVFLFLVIDDFFLKFGKDRFRSFFFNLFLVFKVLIVLILGLWVNFFLVFKGFTVILRFCG